MSEPKPFPWRTLLFISLGVNLLILGAVAGALGAGVRLERQSQAAVVERMPGPRAFMTALPPEIRRKVRSQLVESWVQSSEQREAAAQARRDAFQAAAEEPYDAARVRGAFARLRAADQAAIGVFHDGFADAFGELTPEERRAALESLRNAPAARQGDRLDRRGRRWGARDN
jgi:uncharacterized membrane protein